VVSTTRQSDARQQRDSARAPALHDAVMGDVRLLKALAATAGWVRTAECRRWTEGRAAVVPPPGLKSRCHGPVSGPALPRPPPGVLAPCAPAPALRSCTGTNVHCCRPAAVVEA
jgi:hypothetical protein